MKRRGMTYNALNVRGLQEITPPYLWKLCKQHIPKARYTFAHPAASGSCLLRQGFFVSVRLKQI